MNLNRVKKFAKMLVPALEFSLREMSVDFDRAAIIRVNLEGVCGANNEYILNYGFYWDEGGPAIRMQEIAKEIARIFPNVTVIEQIVFSFEHCVSFIVKQLGDKGTYTINIFWKKS